MAAEQDGLTPAFVHKYRGLPRDGPSNKPVFGPPHPPHIKSKADLFQTILDKLIVDKELYRKAYTNFAEEKTTREFFEKEVALAMILANTGVMEIHEQLMEMHGGGETWQHLDIETWGRRPGVK